LPNPERLLEPKIIFEDTEILVLDKPAGMIVNKSDTTVGEKTVQEWVESYLVIPNSKDVILSETKDLDGILHFVQNDNEQVQHDTEETDFYKRAGIVHRLDKETSGILLVAKTKEAFENMQKQFKERKVKKTYLSLVHGEVKIPEGEINVPVGRLPWNRKRFGVLAEGREAVTRYKVMSLRGAERQSNPQSHEIASLISFARNDRNDKLTLLELYQETGRTHQIRDHLKYFGFPIFADPLYGGRKTARNDRKILSRIFLHAAKISFYHPKTNKLISFESQLPKQLSQFLTTLNS
jgi:23S rRNA pseudouridine1911/1915/1917 synthase